MSAAMEEKLANHLGKSNGFGPENDRKTPPLSQKHIEEDERSVFSSKY